MKGLYPEFRHKDRWPVHRLPGKILLANSRKAFSCVGINVSVSGLSLQSKQSMLPETGIILIANDMEINLSLVWCNTPDRTDDFYQYGFRVQTNNVNLLELFMTEGCISIKVLVVDDDAQIVELFATCLDDQGYEVARATSGKEAAAYIETNPVDLIVSDAVMPNGNGLFLYETTRSRKIPFVVVTGMHSPQRLGFPPNVPVIDKADINLSLLPQVVNWICSHDERSRTPR